MQMSSLQDLYVDQLKDVLHAENQLIKALPKMAKAASSDDLKSAFEDHLEQTKGHVQRLEKIFQNLGKAARGKTCKGMEGLLEEGQEIMQEKADAAVMDAGLIAAAQKVEHYEIASYGTLRTYAQMLGDKDAAKLLQQTLDEESETDEKLTKLAMDHINAEAQ